MKPIRLLDFAHSDEEQSFISHWVHLARTRFSRPYDAIAAQLLPQRLRDSITAELVAEDCDGQLVFPELFDIPFPSPQNPSFTFIDLFAGIGGIRLAYQELGGLCVFSSKWNKDAAKSYFANFGEVPFGDITKIQASTIPDFDVLLAGFPCQPFSIIGAQEGFRHETQGTLFFDIERILLEKKPKAFMLENVRNLTAHDGGHTFEVILKHLRAAGPDGVERKDREKQQPLHDAARPTD